MSRGSRSARALAIVVWAIGLSLVHVAFSRDWLPELASSHGAGIDRMLHYIMISTGAMLLLGHAVLGALLWRSSGRTEPVAHTISHAVERSWSLAVAVAVALIAEGGVLALGLPVWHQYFDSAAPADALVIEVTAEQFGWNVRYAGPDSIFGATSSKLITLDNPVGLDSADPRGADDVVGLNVLHAIAGRPVKIRLRSKDVIHSFFLPNLRVKQDAVPGMTIELWFTPTRAGRFEIACTQLCGFGHYEMKGILIVQTAAEFQQWMEEQTHG